MYDSWTSEYREDYDSTLNSFKTQGVLTKEQVEVMKMHTRYGDKLVTQIPGFQDEKMVRYAEVICRWHHERWNGEGYPDGLKGDEIPIIAQVVSLADAYNSLTNQGGGKEAYSHEKILKMLHRECAEVLIRFCWSVCMI